ncbi:hypothetical protein L1887_50881 [Cichorium endivia]|nr:hypothetical protein L1887_50881 [Cichorium endivia]
MLERRDVPRVAYDLEARVRGAVAEELLKRRADWPERRARVARGINPRVMVGIVIGLDLGSRPDRRKSDPRRKVGSGVGRSRSEIFRRPRRLRRAVGQLRGGSRNSATAERNDVMTA